MDIQWYPGHMAKAKRIMLEDIATVDLLIEVIDARAPRSSRNPDLAKIRGNKPHIIVLNKSDMAEKSENTAWVKYYRGQDFYCCPLNAAQKQGTKALLAAIGEATTPLQQRLAARGRLPRPVRAMVVGIPNCGKSTIINALAPRGSAKTGNKPGVTRGRQWVKTASGLELLDTPGVLWPKFADEQTAFKLAVIGSIADTVFPVNQVAEQLALYLAQNRPQALIDRYKLAEVPAEGQAIIEAVARSRGLLAAGGGLLRENAAALLLAEFKNGKLGQFTLDRMAE